MQCTTQLGTAGPGGSWALGCGFQWLLGFRALGLGGLGLWGLGDVRFRVQVLGDMGLALGYRGPSVHKGSSYIHTDITPGHVVQSGIIVAAEKGTQSQSWDEGRCELFAYDR